MQSLLSIVEIGGYPDFSNLYKKHGYMLLTANTLRQGLKIIKKEKPNIVVAEFNYSPTYGSRISNFESLFATIQKENPQCKIIALVEKEHEDKLKQLENRVALAAKLVFPVDVSKMEACLATL